MKEVTVIRVSENGSDEEFEWKGYWSGQGWYTYDGFRIRVVGWIDDSNEVQDIEAPVTLKFNGGVFTTKVKCASDASDETKFMLAYKKLLQSVNEDVELMTENEK